MRRNKMELNKTKCKDCGHLNKWYSYKWVDSDERAEHNKLHRTTCPECKSNNVEDIEDEEVMAPYNFLAGVIADVFKRQEEREKENKEEDDDK